MSKESMKLSDLLPASSLDVSDVRIPSWLAEEFIERSSAEEDQSTATPKIFLEALLTQRPDRVVEMLQTIGIILSEAPNDELELGVVANLMNDEDVWTHALVEAQHWFSNQIVWGWVEDPFKRPKGHAMGTANGFFHSCLELARNFLITGGDPNKSEEIKKFLREHGELISDSANEPQLHLRWPGWEIYEPRKQPETIHLKRIKRSQRKNETKPDFFARILANVAEETIIQMCMHDKQAYFQSTTFEPKETESSSDTTNSLDPPEVILLKMMFGDLPFDSNDLNQSRQIAKAGHLLGFFRPQTKVDKFMEDFADRALAARKLTNKSKQSFI